MLDIEYRPIGGLCSWGYLAEIGADTASESAATSSTTMAAENAAFAAPGATAETVGAAGQGAISAQNAAAAGSSFMPQMQQALQVLNSLKSLGPGGGAGGSPVAPGSVLPTPQAASTNVGKDVAPASTQESWWKDLLSGTDQGAKDGKLPASIQDNINKQASLV